MKKIFVYLCLCLFLFAVNFVSADVQTTFISGKIYNADMSETIDDANVLATCNGYERTDISENNGTYYVQYNSNQCNEGDLVVVSATKGDLYGSASEIIHREILDGGFVMDLAIVNIPLVPEFGLIAGMATILGAVGLFFYARKNN